MDHMNQEPLDFAAALELLRKAREEIKFLRARPEAAFKEAVYLLECCRGTGDLVVDAWSCFCDRDEIYGLPVRREDRLLLSDVVDAFLKIHGPQRDER